MGKKIIKKSIKKEQKIILTYLVSVFLVVLAVLVAILLTANVSEKTITSVSDNVTSLTSENAISISSENVLENEVSGNKTESEAVAKEDSDSEMTNQLSEEMTLEENAREIVYRMTLEEKVCQLFFITPEALTGVDCVTNAGNTTRSSLEKYPVGGIILFAQNIQDPEQTKKLTSNLKQYSEEISGIPILIGVDEEGGRVARIGKNENFHVTKIGSMSSIAQAQNSDDAYVAGKTIGSYLKEYGFNIDFAPDADVITVSENKVIGDRSFGTDPQIVSEFTQKYIEGLHECDIYACPKHYPGHGGTKEDSHEGAAVSERTWQQLSDSELLPFKDAIKNQIKFIMASHIEVPAVTGDNTPTTLSKILLDEKLRGELGYNGIIITDAMGMGAISNSYSSSKAAVKALEAGADMIMMPQNFQEAYSGIVEAVKAGNISEERIDESVYRIVCAKLLMQ